MLRLRPFALAAFATTVPLAACLLTSDFDNIVGVRPVDDGGGTGTDADDGELGPDGATPGQKDGGTLPPPTPMNIDAGFSCGAVGDHLVCTTFDDRNALPVTGWGAQILGPASRKLVATAPVTQPNALTASAHQDASVTTILTRDINVGAYTSLTMSFDFRLVNCNAQGVNSLTFVFLGSDALGLGFAVLSSGSLAIGTHSGPKDAFITFEVPPDQWSRVSITHTPNGTVSHLAVTVDGVTKIDEGVDGGRLSSPASVNVGIQGVSAPVGCTVAYDNVVIDKQ